MEVDERPAAGDRCPVSGVSDRDLMSSFNATAGAAEIVHDTLLVVLAERPDGDTRIEFQRGLAFDFQDKALGMDTHCLCTEEGTHYGGVLAWSVSENRLRLSLDPAAAKALRLGSEVSIALQMPIAKLRKAFAHGGESALNFTLHDFSYHLTGDVSEAALDANDGKTSVC